MMKLSEKCTVSRRLGEASLRLGEFDGSKVYAPMIRYEVSEYI